MRGILGTRLKPRPCMLPREHNEGKRHSHYCWTQKGFIFSDNSPHSILWSHGGSHLPFSAYVALVYSQPHIYRRPNSTTTTKLLNYSASQWTSVGVRLKRNPAQKKLCAKYRLCGKHCLNILYVHDGWDACLPAQLSSAQHHQPISVYSLDEIGMALGRVDDDVEV